MTTKYVYQMTTKCTKWLQNIQNDFKIYKMSTKYIKWPLNLHLITVKYVFQKHKNFFDYEPASLKQWNKFQFELLLQCVIKVSWSKEPTRC
jgi:hypothetical protein